ncbi:MAG: 1-(5-phosphoribosyl)-5-[(5-phosphoribosylamino)methylideneamino]imidazole-4-carboxamide isomerase [Actinobacteria bacterium HGW-Actinobacteria-7]|nr:MAG: 1-(5-phosphoribosyl)-5-[(5-phosphoribosylamino)methylideneamino]imidazole-4-carboxamide isomerase [Actinobacteria bacterium HGW-Actinobacteria-7]
MIVFPAIDILDGRAVRLAQGDYERVTVYNEDPVAQAREFAEAGAEWVHVVDLDGARDGVPGNTAVIERIVREIGIPVQTGGGIRTIETMARLSQAGVSRMVLGTKLATDPAFVKEAVARFGDHVVAGIDARDGLVAVEGWREGTATPAAELVSELRELGISHLVYTDISRDGMQTGVNVDAYEQIAETAGFPVIASGGVSTLDDFAALAALGPDTVEGAITGRALYEGAFRLKHAIRAARGEY